MTDFATWWAFVMLPQNDGLADDTEPTDGAGVTRWGWTYPAWCDAMRYAGRGSDISMVTFMAMTMDQSGDLAGGYFWTRLGGSRLNRGADVSVLDFAWNSGPSGAVKEIQARIPGLRVDGNIGPLTIAAINALDPLVFVQKCHDLRVAFYDRHGFRKRWPGIYTRSNGILTIARTLIGGAP